MVCHGTCGECKNDGRDGACFSDEGTKVKEECGVAAVYLKKNSRFFGEERVSNFLYNILLQLQHRGQTSSGVAVFSPSSRKRLKSSKEAGKVSNLFKTENVSSFKNFLDINKGVSGIGHVRYATSNVSDALEIIEEEAQPFLRRHGRPWKKFAIAFNGHLTNYDKLKKELVDERGYLLDTDVDTEVLIHLIALELKNYENKPDLIEVFRKVLLKLDGSFSFVFVNALGDVVVCRDRFGFRPLVIGENRDLIAISSESNAFSKIGIEEFRSVEPGEIIFIDGISGSMSCFCDLDNKKMHRHCHFEYVYFSDASSINDGLSVDDVRTNLGREIAKKEKLRGRFGEGGWVVVPVPSTAIPAAMAYSEATGVPISLALVKSDVGRGFINSSMQRNNVMNSKYNVISNRIKGKKVILFDDSIVRGETSARIVSLLREKGKASEVHLRVTEMPIRYPCCYGVDFHTIDELVVGGFRGRVDEAEKFVSKRIGVESMGYLDFEGLKNALGGEEFCFACLNGDYPTESGKTFLRNCLSKKNF